MSTNRLKRKKFLDKLLIKNRLIILNENTFEEIFSFKLNIMSVFVSLSLGAIFLISITTVLIAFTPLREFIPGYSSSQLKRDATVLALKSDSLSFALKKNEAYIKSIQKVLNGDLEYAKFNKDSILSSTNEEPEPVDLSPSKKEMELRERVAQEENPLPASPKGRSRNPKK
ncbi:peptidase [Flavobacterium laiguense]|uniref:Peptidase n=1 Tax=Flavobacterium laiguense TaxID=2169409 RepID=A0A2U1K3K9_9FLAO|nr:peptidase [Flavobacterium laiguense]PWA11538.1 peptidase [Flavobacterium laiguense]